MRKMFCSLILLIGVLFLAAPQIAETKGCSTQAPDNQNTSAERVIKQLENDLNEALVKSDIAKLERLLANEWNVTNSDGAVIGKSVFLSYGKAPNGFQWASIKDENVSVRVFGNSAVVTGRSTRQRQGIEDAIVLQFTRVYAKRNDSWQLVTMHASFIPPQENSAPPSGALDR
jgi:hypothetical protein